MLTAVTWLDRYCAAHAEKLKVKVANVLRRNLKFIRGDVFPVTTNSLGRKQDLSFSRSAATVKLFSYSEKADRGYDQFLQLRARSVARTLHLYRSATVRRRR